MYPTGVSPRYRDVAYLDARGGPVHGSRYVLYTVAQGSADVGMRVRIHLVDHDVGPLVSARFGPGYRFAYPRLGSQYGASTRMN